MTTITTKAKDPQDEVIQSGKWHGYTVKESKEIEELVKKADGGKSKWNSYYPKKLI